jgi:hypothetical protein
MSPNHQVTYDLLRRVLKRHNSSEAQGLIDAAPAVISGLSGNRSLASLKTSK